MQKSHKSTERKPVNMLLLDIVSVLEDLIENDSIQIEIMDVKLVFERKGID